MNLATYQESNGGDMPDELFPPKTYLSFIAEYFDEAQRRDPEWFNIQALPDDRRCELGAKRDELCAAGPMTRERIARFIHEVRGIFDRAFWERQGYHKHVLDQYGKTLAVFIPQFDCWATHLSFFPSPDGLPVVRLTDIEAAEKTEH